MTDRLKVRRAARTLPAMVAFALSLAVIACGKSIFPFANTSPTPTPTATTGGAFAYVSNFNDGKISEFARNITTGALTFQKTISAGNANGPKGLAIDSTGSFLYAANFGAGKILQFAIGSNGKLAAIPPGSVSDGSSSGPEQIATSPTAPFLWVTDFNDGTISGWAINSGSGSLGSNGKFSGLQKPFGVLANAAGNVLYISDNAAGLIYSLAIDSFGNLTNITGSPVKSQGSFAGNPTLFAFDPANQFLYVGDSTLAVVSQFIIQSNGSVLFNAFFSTTNVSPLGLGSATNAGVPFLYTANQGGSATAFKINPDGSLSATGGVAGLSTPTGLAVDPQNQFVYTANQGDGTIAQLQINGACGSLCLVATVASETSGSNAPFAIVLSH